MPRRGRYNRELHAARQAFIDPGEIIKHLYENAGVYKQIYDSIPSWYKTGMAAPTLSHGPTTVGLGSKKRKKGMHANVPNVKRWVDRRNEYYDMQDHKFEEKDNMALDAKFKGGRTLTKTMNKRRYKRIYRGAPRGLWYVNGKKKKSGTWYEWRHVKKKDKRRKNKSFRN